MKIQFKTLLPYISAIVLFLLLSVAYFPEAMQGKKLNQHDKLTWKGGAEEILDYEEETGERSFWTNSMFGGMPTYLVATYAPYNISKYGFDVFDLGHDIRPLSFVFMLLVGFWISLLFFKVDPWLSIVGAIALAFSSYYFIIIEAGHITKVIAIAFTGPIVAGVHYAYRHNALSGTLVLMPFLAMQLLVNHLQITYYTLLIVLIYIIFEAVKTIKEKSYKPFLRSSAFLAVGALLAVSTNLYQIFTTYDYGKDSIRGKSELTFNAENKTSGLDKDYATQWSYGKLETFNLLIPNLYGGASGQAMSENSETYELFKQIQAQNPGFNPKEAIKQMPTYWGPQPFTSGPVYIGALVIFLFVLGLFLVKGRIKWWLVAVTAVSVLLAWGHNFNWLTNLFLEYFPLYNKFRTVSMILVMAEFSIPVLGILAMKNIFEKKVEKAEVIKALKWTGGIVAGIILIFMLNPGLLDFHNPDDARRLGEQLIPAMESDRAAMMRADALRSLLFVVIGFASLWLFVIGKLKREYLLLIIGVAVLVDLWGVNKRYMNSDDFVAARIEKEPYTATQADKFIMNDKELYFRVMNLTVSTFNDASTSYFHKSIGGYHGAKLRRYQDLIDFHISEESRMLAEILRQQNVGMYMIDSVLNRLSVLNMLNTKYFITDPNGRPLENFSRMGNAWFVENVKLVESADEEISALINPQRVDEAKELFNRKNDLEFNMNHLQALIQQTREESKQQEFIRQYQQKAAELEQVIMLIRKIRDFNPAKTAVVHEQFADMLPKIGTDSMGAISLTEYKPNVLKYKVSTRSARLAVFSEVYYPKGWNAYIDGKLTEHFRANYILRALPIPAGDHEIVFKFEPQIAQAGIKGSLFGSILFALAFFGGLFYIIRNKMKEESDEKPAQKT